MDKRLLTIQDISCVGQCSLTVALPIISACGIETAILPGSVLSNHTAPGFSGWTFHDLTDEFVKILEQWKKEGIDFDAFYTGYVSANQIQPILSIMNQTARKNALRIVDPAMADNGKLYAGFSADFPKEMAKLCNGADFILPNLTEASFLLGIDYVGENYSKDYIEKVCKDLCKLGAKNVVLTGVSFEKEKLGIAFYNGVSIDYYFTPRLDLFLHGTGDIYSSAFTGALLNGKSPLKAASIAADFVCKSIELTIGDDKHWYGAKFEKALPYLIKNISE